jgi:hypothetical protein
MDKAQSGGYGIPWEEIRRRASARLTIDAWNTGGFGHGISGSDINHTIYSECKFTTTGHPFPEFDDPSYWLEYDRARAAESAWYDQNTTAKKATSWPEGPFSLLGDPKTDVLANYNRPYAPERKGDPTAASDESQTKAASSLEEDRVREFIHTYLALTGNHFDWNGKSHQVRGLWAKGVKTLESVNLMAERLTGRRFSRMELMMAHDTGLQAVVSYRVTREVERLVEADVNPQMARRMAYRNVLRQSVAFDPNNDADWEMAEAESIGNAYATCEANGFHEGSKADWYEDSYGHRRCARCDMTELAIRMSSAKKVAAEQHPVPIQYWGDVCECGDIGADHWGDAVGPSGSSGCEKCSSCRKFRPTWATHVSKVAYGGDPTVMEAKYASTCSTCGGPINPGEQIFYYPKGKKAMCSTNSCAADAWADFQSAAGDEEFMAGTGNPSTGVGNPFEKKAPVVAFARSLERLALQNLEHFSETALRNLLSSMKRDIEHGLRDEGDAEIAELEAYLAGNFAKAAGHPVGVATAVLDEYGEEVECLDDHGEGTCRGPVEYHSIDPGRTAAFPRCEKHWGDRLKSRENSIERYENSDVAPSWFDESYAGERWDDY